MPSFYAEFEYPPLDFTPLPDIYEPVVISISPMYVKLPPLYRDRSQRVRVVSSSWTDGTVTLLQNYHDDQSYMPMTVDGYSFYQWRAGEERRLAMKRSREQMQAAKNQDAGGGLKVNIPIKSRAVESLFGEGGAGLEVSGSRRISFAGRSDWSDGITSAGNRQSKFPTLRMDQSYEFRITGTIGSKIFVKVNQDSRVNIPLANRLELRFKGSEDDVLKTIEAGNTTLSLSGASLLRYSSQVQGLFGIKTEAQVGAFKFTGIASQEKANTERATITAGASESTTYVRDLSFRRYKIFDLGDINNPDLFESPDDSIIAYRVYRTISGNDQIQTKAKFYLNPRPDPNDPTKVRDDSEGDGEAEPGPIVDIIPEDLYTIFNRQRIIIFDQFTPQSSQLIGVYLQMRRPNGTEYKIGSLGDVQTPNNFTLLMIKGKSDNSNTKVSEYEWKNVYEIPYSLGIDFDDPDLDAIELKIYQGDEGTENIASNLSIQPADGTEYTRILGLDQGIGGQSPDGKVDWLNPLIVDFSRRIVTFPSRRPFDSDTTYGNAPELALKVPGIYQTEKSEQDRRDDSKYYLVFKSKTKSSSIQLPGANIVDGSEVVVANGVTLVRGQDYNVVGNSIQLISDRATDPGADVSVDYEVAPLFTVEKKTLLGARLEYERSRDFNIGGTVLFKSDKATTRKPKVGQETARMFAWDVNAAFRLQPNFLTGMVDAIPGVRAQGPSSISLQGEVARSHPNPNVDGEAFIDDFEGSRQEISLGTNRGRWRISGIPAQINPDTTNRAFSYWYNPTDGIPTRDVYTQETTNATSRIYPLNLVIEPKNQKIDTMIQLVELDTTITIDTVIGVDTSYDTTFITDTVFLDSTVSFHQAPASLRNATQLFRLRVHPNPIPTRSNWAAIKNEFPEGARNQSDAELFEVRMRVLKRGLGGRIHFEFGRVSEDVIPNARLDQEGDIQTYSPDFAEDIGIDKRTDAQERTWYNDVLDSLQDKNDPQYDNFPYQEGETVVTTPAPLTESATPINQAHIDKLRRINGTENNHVDPEFIYVDTEDRVFGSSSYNSSISLVNAYFSFSASLDLSALQDNFFVEGSERYPANDQSRPPWVTLRLPIKDLMALDTIIGDARWTDIDYVRIWVDSLPDTTMIQIADMKMVSSNWEDKIIYRNPGDSLISPTQFTLSVINTAEDSAVYQSPPGVTGNVDQINDIIEPEQSLRLTYENLVYGDTGFISKTQTSSNYMGYGELRMWVHGDDAIGANHQVNFFYRMGTDSLNYYEFRTSLAPGWAPENEVVMNFAELTAIKDEAIRNDMYDSTGRLNSGNLDPKYRVVGLPTLRGIRYIASGISNADATDSVFGVNGETWIDELRLTEVRNDIGTATRASLSGNIGDFITSYNASVSYTDPYYLDIARGTRLGNSSNLGSGKSDLNYSFSVNFAGEKLLPPSLDAKIPIRLSYSRTKSTPLLVTANNSDIILPEERRAEEASISESKGFSIRESFNKRTRNPLYTILLNKLSTDFSYNRNYSTTPTIPSSLSESYSVGMQYSVPAFPKLPRIPIFFMFSRVPVLKKLSETQLNVGPTNLNLRSNFDRSLNVTQNSQNGTLTSRFSRTLSSSFSTGFKWTSNLSSSFNLSHKSDLRESEWFSLSPKNFRLGKTTRFQQNVSHDYSPDLFKFLTHRFAFSASYSEVPKQNQVDVINNPADSALEPLDVSQNIRYSVSGNFDLQKFFGSPTARRDVRRETAQDLARRAAELRRRSRGDTTAVDTTDAEKEEKADEPSGPWIGEQVYDASRSVLRKLTGFLDPVSYSLERNQSVSKNGLRYRPGLGFRFGFTDETNVPIAPLNQGARAVNNFSEGQNWRLGSGVKFLGGGLGTTIDISENRTRSFPTTGTASENVDRTWPRLNVRIGILRGPNIWGLRTIQSFLNSLINRFQPRTSYSRRTTYNKNLTTGVISSESETIDRAPLIGVTIPVYKQLAISAQYETSEGTRTNYNFDNGAFSGKTEDNSNTIRLSTSYSFRAPQGLNLPIFGRVKIQSNVTMKFDVLMRSNESYTIDERDNRRLTSRRKTFSAQYNATYAFSQQVRGGVTASWTDSDTDTRTSHSRELRFFAEMRF